MEPRLRPLGRDALRIDASVPSLRPLLVVVGLAAVGVSVWAVARDTWEPLLLLIPFILLLPPQVRRQSSDSRFGNALWSCVLAGLASGLTGWINGNSGLQAVSTALVVGGVVGLLSALMWSRRRPRKWASWLRSAP